MVLIALTAAAGAVVGSLRGGCLRNLGAVRLQWPALVGMAVVCQLALTGAGHGTTRLVLLVAVNAALVAFAWMNRLLPGMGLLMMGFMLNAAVIIANSGMPVSPWALQAIGGQPAIPTQERHQLLEEGDRLAVLGDVLPVPVLRSVYSVGDIVVAAGVGVLMANLVRHPPRHAAN